MKINNTYEITKRHGNVIFTNLIDNYFQNYGVDSEMYATLISVLKVLRNRSISNKAKNNLLRKLYIGMGFNEEDIEIRLIELNVSLEEKKEAVKNLINFFSEFNFAPSYRFINTLALNDTAESYVTNYFLIQDFEYANEIAEKITSAEFKAIIQTLHSGDKPSNIINSRMKIYYGEPGTGKTTQAMTESTKCVVCSSDMLPADLMQNFAFNDGKAGFEKSDLWIAMEEGQTIVLDEINMLPFESLRFLQGITDGKTEIDYKGFNIQIKPGFQIIGTMNLTLGGVTMGIPAPLVDRCSDIKKFTLDADALIGALI